MGKELSTPRSASALLLTLSVLAVAIALLLGACQPSTLPPEGGIEPSSTQSGPTATPGEDRLDERVEMVELLRHSGIEDESVLEAMRTVPRHLFVPEEYQDQAYANRPLPIGYGQTISQPYVVAYMTEQLALKPGAKVLEIGTGSGYQAAVLAALGEVEVYSVEIIPELASAARERLQALGYENVHVDERDGYYGWPEHAPYDAIIVTAAPDHLPQPLVQQLKPNGRLVIPIGPPGSYQTLWLFVNEAQGLTAYNLGGVRFVPLTGPGTEEERPTPTLIP